jgi:hypothetical protein
VDDDITLLFKDITHDVVESFPSGTVSASDDLIDFFVNNSNGVRAWKKFIDDGLPPAFRRNIINLKQRSIIDEWAGNIASASNKRKGNFGEIGADLDLNSKSYESLIDRIDDIDAGGHNGLDGVFRKDGQYYIVEGKYSGAAQINGAVPPNLPRQMSDDWIATRSWDEVNLDQIIIDDLIENKNYERILAKTAPDGTVSYSKIDADGYEISGSVWNP